MLHPYHDLSDKFYWRRAVAEPGGLGISSLWTPKFPIRKSDKFITAGSCFAQHISRRLVDRGYSWLDAEPGPEFVSAQIKKKYNYGVFSFRTGNIYTSRMLLQWMQFAFGEADPLLPALVRDGRYYDPYRQQIEPDGFESEDELERSRDSALAAVRTAFTEADVLLFTFGLTEAWQDIATGQEYSACPGVVAGSYEANKVAFVNHSFGDILTDFRAALRLINKHRSRNIRVVTTVSPVPLTATASEDHVLVATTYSKSVLRAVAGQLHMTARGIDYFPSYEVVTSPVSRGMHYAGNLRSVAPQGVDNVLSHFFSGIEERAIKATPPTTQKATEGSSPADDDVVCDEVILDAFAK